jgi:hypothetical protein
VTFLDDDDRLLPRMLEISLEAAARSRLPRPVAVLSGIVDVDDAGRRLAPRFPPTLPRGSHYFLEPRIDGDTQCHNTLVVQREVIMSVGGWDEELPGGWEHDDLFLRLNAVCSLQGVAEPTYEMVEHAGPRLRAGYAAVAYQLARTANKHAELFEQHPRKLAHYLGALGVYELRARSWLPAVRATTLALRTDPSQTRLWKWWVASLAGPRVVNAWSRCRRLVRSAAKSVSSKT